MDWFIIARNNKSFIITFSTEQCYSSFLVLRYAALHLILEALRIEWRNLTPRFAPARELMKILNISYSRVGIEPIPSRLQ